MWWYEEEIERSDEEEARRREESGEGGVAPEGSECLRGEEGEVGGMESREAVGEEGGTRRRDISVARGTRGEGGVERLESTGEEACVLCCRMEGEEGEDGGREEGGRMALTSGGGVYLEEERDARKGAGRTDGAEGCFWWCTRCFRVFLDEGEEVGGEVAGDKIEEEGAKDAGVGEAV